MKLKDSENSVGHLVDPRKSFLAKSDCLIWCTISPNPKTLHKCEAMKRDGRRRDMSIPYGNCPQKAQYLYCRSIIEKCYIPFLSDDFQLYGTWELNKSNNVHLHFIIYDKQFASAKRLAIFQRDVSLCEEVIKNLSKKDQYKVETKIQTQKGLLPKDYMNNICKLTKDLEEVLDYMDKDYDENDPVFSNYYYFPQEIETPDIAIE